METSLADLNSAVLFGALAGLLIGWFITWIYFRTAAQRRDLQVQMDNAEKETEIDAQKSTIATLDAKLNEYEHRSNDLAKEKLLLEEQSASLRQENIELTSKLELLETSENENSEEIAALEENLAQLEKSLTEAHAEHESALITLHEKNRDNDLKLANELKARSEENEKLKRQNNDLIAKAADTEQELAALAQKLAQGQQKPGDSHQNIYRLQDRISEQSQTRHKLEEDISGLESSLKAWQQKASRTTADLAQAQQTIRSLQSEAHEQTNTSPSYERLISIKDREIEEQKQRSRATQTKLLAVRDEIETRDKQLASLTTEANANQARHRRELASLKNKFEKELSERTAESTRVQSRLNDVEREVLQLEAKNTRLEQQITTVTAREKTQLEQQQHAAVELQKIKNELRESDTQASQITRQRDQFQRDYSTTSQENRDLKARLEQSLKEIQAKAHANESLSVSNERQSQHIAALEKQLQKPAATPAKSSSNDARPAGLLSKKPARIDDLKRIKGVGPKLEKMLHKLGLYQFRQIAELKAKDVAWVDTHI
ncbi:MAG: hypothetical protein AAF387_17620, partial [Pseudomonadota bacterium]